MYEAMTIAQLQSEQTTLYEQMKAVNAKKRAIDAELDRRAATAEAENVLAAMSPDARAHLAQRLGASGIMSRAAVGMPGTR